MAKRIISRGSSANDGTGDNLRDGANKVNLNFDEIYTAIGDGTTVDGTIKIADDSSTVMTLSANGETVRILGGSGITSTVSSNDLTLAVDGTVLSATQTSTLTNKTINGPDNTLTNIANGSLSNSTITVTGDSGSTAIDLGDTLTVNGTTNQITTAQSGDTLTLSLPSAVTLPGSLTVTGNFTVNGTQSVIDSTTIEVTNSFTFEGTTSDDFETVLTVENPTADRTVTIPNATGTIVLKDTTDTLTNKTIAAGSNTITGLVNANLSGSAGITNANLANSSVTIGADTISLGGTQTTITDLNLDGTSSLSGTGTIDTTGSGNKLRFNFANTGSLPTAATYEGMFAYDIGGNNPYVADAGGWVKILTENSSIADISNVGSIASISAGQVLAWNAGGYFEPASQSGGLASVVADTTPQLGGDLDANTRVIGDVAYVSHRSPDATVTKTLTVTVATKTNEHTAYGDGSSSGYVIDGHEGAHLSMTPGVYKFDQADSSNSGHPLRFYRESDKSTSYTSNITTSGTPGSSGAHTTITISKETPSTLYYQCSAHANMGGVLSNIGSESPTIKLPDNDVAYFGAGSDLQILHDGSSSVIKDVTGNQLYFQSTNFNVSNSSGLKHIYANNGYGVTLYYQDAAKIETTTTGVDVTGEVKADKAYIAEATLTDQATIAWDMATESVCKVTLAGNRTMAAPSNGSTGQFASILVIQDGTGSRTITWNGIYEFASDTAPTLTTTASLGDLFTFRYNGSKWLEVGRNQALTLS